MLNESMYSKPYLLFEKAFLFEVRTLVTLLGSWYLGDRKTVYVVCRVVHI